MAIVFVGAVTGGSTAPALPAHQTGDIIVVFAYRDNGVAASPTTGAGYTSITSGSNATYLTGSRLGYKIATSSAETIGAWTNATNYAAAIYRENNGGTLGIGASTQGTNTGTGIQFNGGAVTLIGTNNASWWINFCGVHGATDLNTMSTSPLVRRSAQTTAPGAAAYDFGAPLTGTTGTTVTLTSAISDSWRTSGVEITTTEPLSPTTITGAATPTDVADTAAASGTVAFPTITGTSNKTETSVDAAAAAGKVEWRGTIAVTDIADVVASPGKVEWTGTSAVTDIVDAAAAAGKVEWRGTAAVTDIPDSASASGQVEWRGTIAKTETSVDTAAATGYPDSGSRTFTSSATFYAPAYGVLTVTALGAKGGDGQSITNVGTNEVVPGGAGGYGGRAIKAYTTSGPTAGSSIAISIASGTNQFTYGTNPRATDGTAGSDAFTSGGGGGDPYDYNAGTNGVAGSGFGGDTNDTGYNSGAASLTVSWTALRSGAIAVTETSVDTASASGTVVFPAVTGTSTTTETSVDAASASGAVTWPVITGAAALTEISLDTASAAGTAEDQHGAIAVTESTADVAAATGWVDPTFAIALTEAADVCAAVGFPVPGAISNLSTTTASSNIILLPATTAGDLFIAAVSNVGATTAITLPSGWTSIGGGTVNGGTQVGVAESYLIAYKVCSTAAAANVTFADATTIVVSQYRQFGGALSLANPSAQVTSATGSSVSWGGTASGGNSWEWAALIHGVSSTSFTASAGWTKRAHLDFTTVFDTNSVVSGAPSGTASGGAVGPYMRAAAEIVGQLAVVYGPITPTESPDVCAASGWVTAYADIALIGPQDAAAATGLVSIEGAIAISAPTDVCAASGTVVNVGAIAVTGPQDVVAATGQVSVSGTIALSAPTDVAAATGWVDPKFAIALVEAKDVCAVAATVADPLSGTINVTGPTDSAAIAGRVQDKITGASALTETAADGAAGLGFSYASDHSAYMLCGGALINDFQYVDSSYHFMTHARGGVPPVTWDVASGTSINFGASVADPGSYLTTKPGETEYVCWLYVTSLSGPSVTAQLGVKYVGANGTGQGADHFTLTTLRLGWNRLSETRDLGDLTSASRATMFIAIEGGSCSFASNSALIVPWTMPTRTGTIALTPPGNDTLAMSVFVPQTSVGAIHLAEAGGDFCTASGQVVIGVTIHVTEPHDVAAIYDYVLKIGHVDMAAVSNQVLTTGTLTLSGYAVMDAVTAATLRGRVDYAGRVDMAALAGGAFIGSLFWHTQHASETAWAGQQPTDDPWTTQTAAAGGWSSQEVEDTGPWVEQFAPTNPWSNR